MLYRKNPKNGDELSILGFGAMRLPLNDDGSIDQERATFQVRYAIDHGVNYVDTAWPYHMGESEPFIGRALGDGYREKVKLATKLPQWMVREYEDMDRFLNSQLEKLNTSHIDYYLVHSLIGSSWEKIHKLGVLDFLDRAKVDGRIINAGFSFHGTTDDFKKVIDAYDWDFCQIQYNFLDTERQVGTEGLEYAASKGLGIIIMEPLRGGNIARNVPPAIQEIWNEAELKRSAAEWALRWVWNRPEVTVVLSGMNEEAHIEENLRIAGEAFPDSLSHGELELVDRVAEKYSELMKIDCTACKYCMPCPQGVEIPHCFEMYNNMHMFGNEEQIKMMYVAKLGGILNNSGTGFASQCTQCGKCLDECPQSLPIPDLLEKIVEEFEDEGMEKRRAIAKQLFMGD
ncbi:aldo/keto reductase [Methanolobus sp. ZRKC3]|uniref:aldo/keto reductase n=1 Tax=Methanolobus sp. ZRKC3 TaxID=3125786 RepID=UPI00324FDA3D